MNNPNINVFVGGPINTKAPSAYKTKVLKGNLPFETQVTDADTIYIVKNDFDLNSQTVDIPEGCVLEFDGGSISGGKIEGNNTGIVAPLVKVFDSDTLLLGTWNNKELYAEWFGAVAGGENSAIEEQISLSESNLLALQAAIYSAMSTGIPLQLLTGTYIVKHGLQWDTTSVEYESKTLTIRGNGSNNTILRLPDGELDRIVDGQIEARGGVPYTLTPIPEDPTKNTIREIRVYDRWISGGLKTNHPANIHFIGLCFDKNARSNVKDSAWLAQHYPVDYYTRRVNQETSEVIIQGPFQPTYLYYAESSNCLHFYGSYENLSVKDICVKDRYASGVSFGNPEVTGITVIEHIYEDGDDSARYGARESLYPLIICPKITIQDCMCNIQIEPVASQQIARTGKIIRTEIFNCVLSSLEFNEGDTASLESSFVCRDCVFDTGYFNLEGNYPILIENCIFHMNTTRSVIWNDVVFRNCKFFIDTWFNDNTIPSIYPRLLSKVIDGNTVFYAPKPIFDNCTFKTTVERPEGASGSLFIAAANTPSYEITFKDCDFDLDLNAPLFSAAYGFIAKISGCVFNVTGDTLIAFGSFGYNRRQIVDGEEVAVSVVSHAEVYFKDSKILNNQGFTVTPRNYNHNRGKISGVFNGVKSFIKSGAGLTGVDGSDMIIMADENDTVTGKVYPKGVTIIREGISYKYTSETDGIAITDFIATLLKKVVTSAERAGLVNLPVLPIEVYDNDLHKVLYSKLAWDENPITITVPSKAGSSSPIFFTANPFTKGRTYKGTATGSNGKLLFFSKTNPSDTYTKPEGCIDASTGNGDTFVAVDPAVYPYVGVTSNNAYEIVFSCALGEVTWLDTLGNALGTSYNTGDLSNYVQKSETVGLLKNDGTVDTNTYVPAITGGTTGNVPKIKEDGTLEDSGKAAGNIPTDNNSNE